MHQVKRLIKLAIATTALLMAWNATASADQLGVSEDHFLVTWTPLTIVEAGQTISCPITINGSFHNSTLDKTPGELHGHITSAIVRGGTGPGECVGGTMTLLTGDLPWHLPFDGFIGELPIVSSVTFRLVGVRMAIDPSGSLPACLSGTDASDPAIIIAELGEEGAVTGARADETASIDLGGGFLCELAGSSYFSGTGVRRNASYTHLIIVSLV